jgi:membrane protein
MDAFDRIYAVRRERSFRERMAVSLALGLAVAVLLLAAAVYVTLAPLPAWVRWPVAAVFLVAVDALLITFAPAEQQPLHWITAGTALSVAAWLGTSVALGWYATSVANYGSVYGGLATFVILLTYLYFAAAAFLTGVEIDDLLRDRTVSAS